MVLLRVWHRYWFGLMSVLTVFYIFLLWLQPVFLPPPLQIGDQSWRDRLPEPEHPITRLIASSQKQYKEVLGKQSSSLEEAAARYRKRRGRHPPPGFDIWFRAARDSSAFVIEDFFDRIYHDLGPLWALKPSEMRRQTYSQLEVIRIRNGQAALFSLTEKANLTDMDKLQSIKYVSDNPHNPAWIQLWTDLVNEVADKLPDLDMAINVMEQTRLLVPWEKMKAYMKTEVASRKVIDPRDVTSEYSRLNNAGGDPKDATDPYVHSWIAPGTVKYEEEAAKYWDHFRVTCPPGTPSRKARMFTKNQSHIEYPQKLSTAYTRDGYISNVTAARDPCLQPLLRGMHGTFVKSHTMSTSHDLMPMFSGSKLPQNNEILLPGAMYLSVDSGKDTRKVPWHNKNDSLIWRGPATGGLSTVDNWWHFHRHRWVQMNNGSAVEAAESRITIDVPTFRMPFFLSWVYPQVAENVPFGRKNWLNKVTDVGLTDLMCTPFETNGIGLKFKNCSYTDKTLALLDEIPLDVQYGHKFLADVDGNTYSRHWHALLRSGSMPLKATIYAEWHDDRLFPWVHYVPMDNSYLDLFGILDYFVKGSSRYFHDSAAQTIAEEGRNWAEKVLRREDMRLYVWRLLLEYARVVDDKRHSLGYVGDLAKPAKRKHEQ